MHTTDLLDLPQLLDYSRFFWDIFLVSHAIIGILIPRWCHFSQNPDQDMAVAVDVACKPMRSWKQLPDFIGLVKCSNLTISYSKAPSQQHQCEGKRKWVKRHRKKEPIDHSIGEHDSCKAIRMGQGISLTRCCWVNLALTSSKVCCSSNKCNSFL